jgi:hypothetical protein
MVSAELALAMPVLVACLAVSLAAVQLGIEQVRCIDAARSAVRLLARGEGGARAVREARVVAPEDAVVSTGSSGDYVSVTVSAPPPRILGVIGLHVSPGATASAMREGWG